MNVRARTGTGLLLGFGLVLLGACSSQADGISQTWSVDPGSDAGSTSASSNLASGSGAPLLPSAPSAGVNFPAATGSTDAPGSAATVPGTHTDAPAGGGSSATPTEAAPSASVPVTQGACGALISDMEDGFGAACLDSDRKGVWYAYNQEQEQNLEAPTHKQFPDPLAPGVAISMSEIPGGRAGSRYAVYTHGSGLQYSGIGIDLAFDGTTYGTYDASAFTGITFWARSDVATPISVRVGTALTTIPDYGGTCDRAVAECWPSNVARHVTTEWHQQWVPFSQLNLGASVSEITNIQFEIRTNPFDLWIDDLSFYSGPAGCCTDAPASCQGDVAWGSPGFVTALREMTHIPERTLGCTDVCYLESFTSYDAPDMASISGIECLQELRSFTAYSTNLQGDIDLSVLPWLEIVFLQQTQATSLMLPPSIVTASLLTNQLETVTLTGPAPKLVTLDLQHNQLRQLPDLRGSESLHTLAASYNQLAGPNALDTLAGAPNLVDLSVDNNQLQDLSPLSELTQLIYLSVNSNQLTTLSGLEELRSLYSLSARDNPFTDVSALGPDSLITYVVLADIPHLDLTQLSLAHIQTLDISNGTVTDLAPLATVTGLLALIARNNAILDLHPLLTYPILRNVDVGGNPFTCDTQADVYETLQTRVTYLVDSDPVTGKAKCASP